MAKTYEPIATTTLAGGTSYTFSSIPSTYTDLILISNSKFGGTRTIYSMQFNGDTATNYSYTNIAGNGTSAISERDPNSAMIAIGLISDQWQTTTIQIQNYSNTTTYKTNLSRGNSLGTTATQDVNAYVGTWRSTAAINAIKVYPINLTAFTSGTTLTLYGIKAA